jgi:hypothetical protein
MMIVKAEKKNQITAQNPQGADAKYRHAQSVPHWTH